MAALPQDDVQSLTSYPNDSMPSDVSDASDDLGEGAFGVGRQATKTLLAAKATAPQQAPGVQVGLPRPVIGASNTQSRQVDPDLLTQDTSEQSTTDSSDTESEDTVTKEKAHPWLPNWSYCIILARYRQAFVNIRAILPCSFVACMASARVRARPKVCTRRMGSAVIFGTFAWSYLCVAQQIIKPGAA